MRFRRKVRGSAGPASGSSEDFEPSPYPRDDMSPAGTGGPDADVGRGRKARRALTGPPSANLPGLGATGFLPLTPPAPHRSPGPSARAWLPRFRAGALLSGPIS